MLSSFQVGATTRTDTKRNLYIKDCVFESGQTDKQCRAKNWCHIRTNLKRNLYIKDCIFKSVLSNLIHGTSKHKMQYKQLWLTTILGKLSNKPKTQSSHQRLHFQVGQIMLQQNLQPHRVWIENTKKTYVTLTMKIPNYENPRLIGHVLLHLSCH